MSLFFLLPAGTVGGVVTLTNLTVYDFDFGPSVDFNVGVRLNADGTLDEQSSTGYVQRNSGTDWIIPNSAGTTQYYVRATEVSYVENELNPNIFGTKSGDAVGSWITLGNGQTREWYLRTQSNTAGLGDITWVIDIEIATDALGTDILDTGRFTLKGEVF